MQKTYVRPKRTRLSSTTMSLVGIPKEFHEKTIADFQTFGSADLKLVKNHVQSYIEGLSVVADTREGLFFSGSNGVGKTMLSSLILKEAYLHRYSVRRCTFREYVDQYTRSWAGDRDAEEDSFNHGYKTVEFLVIEELGKEIDSKIAIPVLDDCLRYREDNRLVTIICTNLSFSQIKSKYGASISSLIQGNMTPIIIEADDRRPEFFDRRKDGE